MVVGSLTVGALVGIALSGGFVYWEVGRFAEPQVPVTRFDERREMFAYTAGLFVGVPLAVALVLFRGELSQGDLIGALLLLAGLAGGTELAQYLLLRSRYWAGPAGPFYALGFRAAVGGILALGVVATYLSGPLALGYSLAAVLVSAVALVALEVAGALLSLRPIGRPAGTRGGPGSGALFALVGFLLLGLGPIAGGPAAAGAAVVLLLGAGWVYLRRRPVLEEIAAPEPPRTDRGEPPATYGRTDPPRDGSPSGESKPR